MRTHAPIACFVVALLLMPATLHAEEAPASAESAAPTVTVKRGPLGGVVKTKGVLVPATYERATLEFDAYRGKLEIVETAPEGRVVKGQTLVRFDEEPYKETLAAAERDLQIKRIGLDRAERLHELGKASSALKRDETLRAKRLADEALERFVEVERKLREEDSNYSFEGRRIGIQNMREELAQLEKMYTEDDLTEETEEIVLKRNRRNMERMLDSFERWKKRHDYSKKINLEREFEKLRLSVRKATGSLERLQATLPLDRKKAELDLVNARESLRKAEEHLGKLRADGSKLTLKAPIAGLAVRGSFSRGSWSGLGNDEAYETGETMKAGSTPYTIVDESVMRVHTSIKEEDVPAVKAGAAASIKTAFTGKVALEAEVGSVARYGSGGSYAVILRVKAEDKRLRAGLGATVEITRHAPEEVLSIPKGAIRTTDGTHHVFGTDGEAIEIEVGKKAGDRVEVTMGLVAGQEILAKPPEVAKATPDEGGKSDK